MTSRISSLSSLSLVLARRLTYFEGLFFAIMVATTESYALYYFTKNGLNNVEVATLASVPLLIGALAQLSAPWISKRFSVGIILVISMAVQAIGIGLILYLLISPGPFWALLFSFMLYWAGGQTAGPMWMDWISEIIPAPDFPKFIGWRNTMVTLVVLFFYVACSFLLTDLKSFALLFAGGLLARLGSMVVQLFLVLRSPIQHKHHDHDHIHHEDHRSDLEENPNERKKIFLTFFLIMGLFRLACYLSAPFFTPYMIREMKLDTVTYVLLTAIPYIGRALFIQNWGSASKGIRPFWGAQIASIFIAFLPPLWILSSNFFYLSLLQIMSGIFWAGMEITMLLVVQNLYYGHARFLLSLQNAIFVFFSVLGSMIGAQLLESGLGYTNVFLISGGLRFSFALLLIFTFAKYHKLSLHRWNSRLYLTSILSLRPSLEAVGRLILPPRRLRKRRPDQGLEAK